MSMKFGHDRGVFLGRHQRPIKDSRRRRSYLRWWTEYGKHPKRVLLLLYEIFVNDPIRELLTLASLLGKEPSPGTPGPARALFFGRRDGPWRM